MLTSRRRAGGGRSLRRKSRRSGRFWFSTPKVRPDPVFGPFAHLNEDNKGRIEKDKKELDIVEQRIAENRAAVRSVLMDLEKSLEGKK